MDVRFAHPSPFMIAGPGKTFFVRRALQSLQKLFTRMPQRSVWLYGEYQSFFRDYPNVELEEGLSYLERFTPGPPTLIIIDDLLFATELHNCSQKVAIIKMKASCAQNLFDQSKQQRTISLNAHYLVGILGLESSFSATSVSQAEHIYVRSLTS